MHPLLQLAQLLKVLGRVDGRKKLQKVVHILKELGVPFTEPFEYSLHGMYSQQLRGEVESLVSGGLVAEEPYGEGQMRAYTYTANLDLTALLKEGGLSDKPEWASLARELNRMTPRQAEGVSTALFLRRRGLRGQELASRLLELKPHLSGDIAYSTAEAERLAGAGLPTGA